MMKYMMVQRQMEIESENIKREREMTGFMRKGEKRMKDDANWKK